MKKRAFFWGKKNASALSLLFYFGTVLAQPNIGIPDIRNYPRSEYKAGSQNWGIVQDEQGIVYVGNNEGLLSFDGTRWQLYPLPKKGNVRSLAAIGNRIYIGGQEEIGFFAPNRQGALQYNSLKELIPALYRHDFADVWNVVERKAQVFFRSNRHIFLYEKGKITAFQSFNWSFLGKVGDTVFAFDDVKGLCQYENGEWRIAIPIEKLPANIQVSNLLAVGRQIWIVSYNNGIFKWDGRNVSPFSTAAINDLKTKMLYGAVRLSDSKLAFVSNLSGCVVLDTSGNFVNRFTYTQGLQSNNVICSFVDKDRNLWLGLDDGIDIVVYKKPIRNIRPGEDGPTAGYVSTVFQHYLFLGTSTGLFKVKYDEQKGIGTLYEKMPTASGQVWDLSIIQNKLFVGLNKSAMVYSDGRMVEINKKQTGFWNFQRLPGTGYIVSGTYNGLHYFQLQGNNTVDIGIEALFESAKYVAINGRTIWAIHPYKGLYRVDLSESGLPVKTTVLGQPWFLSSSNNHLFKVEDRIVATSDKGIFEWDTTKQTFVPSEYFISIFGNKNLEYLKRNNRGDYWFVQNGHMGVASPVGSHFKLVYFPELNGRLQFGDNEDIHFLNDSCAIVAAEKGFFYVNYAQYSSHSKDFNLLIRSFHIETPQGDSLVFGGYPTAGMEVPNLAYRFNSVLFTYSVPVFGYTPAIQYSYKLEGFDPAWSSWSEKTEKNYTNLPPGKYIFKVKARNEFLGNEKETSFDFVVLAPWYRSNVAYVLYFIAFLCLVYFVSWYQYRRYIAMQTSKLEAQEKEHEKQRRELSLRYSLEQEKKEKQLAEMTNEKLAMELKMKNTAIASNAMLLVQKGELLSKVKKDLSELLDTSKVEKPLPQIKKIIKTVDAELNNKEEWDKFASHFDTVHENYLQKLKESYPQLTYGDLKLCALLRLGMSSKEIAGVLNISLKGVEVGRYRLRKKLNIGEEESLFGFLTK